MTNKLSTEEIMKITAEHCRPKYFDPDLHMKAAENLVLADELVMALNLLDSWPAYFRDHPYDPARKLKQEILRQIWTINDYVSDHQEESVNSIEREKKWYPDLDLQDLGDFIKIPFYAMRGTIAAEHIKEFNDKGMTPHIVELSPANFWLPHSLRKMGLKFTYEGKSLQKTAELLNKEALQDIWQSRMSTTQPNVFICFETLEHLWREDDIYHEYAKLGIECDSVLISTPKYTLLGGEKDWHRELGHVRTYTPKDLCNIVGKWFPKHSFQYFDGVMMVVQGVLNDSTRA